MRKAIVFLMFLGIVFFPNFVDAASTLPDAIDGVITLSEDVTLSSNYTINEEDDITLDLAGNTLTTSGYIYVYGNLTIEDSIGDGEIVFTKCYFYVNGSTAKLTLNDVDVTNNKSDRVFNIRYSGTVIINGGNITTSGIAFVLFNDGKIIVNDGTIEADTIVSDNNTLGNMNVEINGGILTATSGLSIYFPAQGNVTITGGTINGGMFFRMGNINISGGTINASDTFVDVTYNLIGGSWLSAEAIVLAGGTYDFTSGTGGNGFSLNITGGTLNSSGGSAITLYDLGKVKQDINVNISGGIFNSKEGVESYRVVEFSELGVEDSAYGIYSGDVSTTIKGGTYSENVNDEYIASGYVSNAKDNNYVVEKQSVSVDASDVETGSSISEVTVGVDLTTDYQKVINDALTDSDIDINSVKSNVVISVEVETVEEKEVSEEALKDITDLTSSLNYTISSYIDITLNVYYDSDMSTSIGTLEELSNPITFKVALSSELQEVKDGYTRNYYIIRYHDGTAEKIETTLSDDGTYLTFVTDKFSTYALAYVDVESTTVTNPSTGDSIITSFVLALLSLGGISYIVIRRRKTN